MQTCSLKSRKHGAFFRLALLLVCLTLLFGCGAQKNEAPAQTEAPTPEDTQTEAPAAEDAAPNEGGTQNSETISVLDGMQRTIEVPANAERIVVLSPAEAEILCELGAESRLVGKGTYCNYPATLGNVPVVASGSETNVEEILALKPDLVIMNTMDQTKDVVTLLETSGVCVLVTTSKDIENVYTSIRLLGKALSLDEQAEKAVAAMQADFAAMPDLSRILSDGSLYFEVSPLEWGLWSAGSDTFYQEIADAMHLKNLFADTQDWVEVSEEQVLSRNPSVILALTGADILGKDPIEEICARPGWDKLDAVKNRLVLYYDADALSRPGPRLSKAALELAQNIEKAIQAQN